MDKQKGDKITVESGSWKVEVDHIDVMGGSHDELFDTMYTAFRAVFGDEIAERYFNPKD